MRTYSIVDLYTFKGYLPITTAISNTGVIVGSLTNNQAMRYKAGTIKELHHSVPTDRGLANGISPSHPERIVGTVSSITGDRAALWTNGVYTDLHPLVSGMFSEAYDVNDSGIVVGQAEYRGEPPYPPAGFRFDTTTQQLEMLVIPAPMLAVPRAINKSGHVAGFTAIPYTASSQLFFYDTAVHLISTPGDVYPYVYPNGIDINDADVIMANYLTADGHLHGFTYDFQSKVFTDIQNAAGVPGVAHSINNDGAVVGTCWDGHGFAMIWTPSDGMRRLDDLVEMESGWMLTEADAINDAGEITGWGTFYGQKRAFLLSPIDDDGKLHPHDLVAMVKEIVVAGGGMGILLPGGGVIYPKDGPVDPDSPLQRLDAARSDAAIGLAMQVLAQRITDPSTRALAEKAAAEITRSAAASAGSPRSAAGRSNWLSRLVRDIADELER